MARFQCLFCGEEFGCKSSHYCLEKEFRLVTPANNQDFWVENIDWTEELILNNEYLNREL